MRNLSKSLLILIFITLLQFAVYDLFLKPIITTWGAAKNEVSMPMAGDSKTLTVTSTRAILINAPKADVWQWLIQLGADRAGFFSYEFIEEALGYKTRQPNLIAPEFKNIAVGDIVRGSINEKSSLIPYNFPVIYVQPGKTFVLENWGTFLLEDINGRQTRLVIRTQEMTSSNLWGKVAQTIAIPLHYIMERRTLMGIKARIEIGENVHMSQRADIFWFTGIVLSILLIYSLVFISRGFTKSIIIPSAFSLCWLYTLMLLNPIPLYSNGLLLIVCGYILSTDQASIWKNQK